MFWNWSWPARILCGAVLGFGAFLVWSSMFARVRDNMKLSGCHSNLKQIGLGFLQYQQDYGDKLPLAASGGTTFGWADALQPYLKSTQLYQCPQQREDGQINPKQSGYTDYAFNSRYNGKTMKTLAKPERAILTLDGGDGEDRTDARYSFSEIPKKWRQDDSSPLFRHSGGANFLFAYGNVKSLSPWRVQDASSVIF